MRIFTMGVQIANDNMVSGLLKCDNEECGFECSKNLVSFKTSKGKKSIIEMTDEEYHAVVHAINTYYSGRQGKKFFSVRVGIN